MITEQACGRVIVRIDDSLAGLAAVREAVGLARLRHLELQAVCTFPPVLGPIARERAVSVGEPGASARREWPPYSHWQVRERQAETAVERIFGEAMGRIPRDIHVKTVVVDDRERDALIHVAYHEGDWLVVPTQRRRWWRFGRHSARYVVAHADCPVVVVPPPRAADEFDCAGRPWRRLRRRRELSSLISELTA